MRRPYHRLPHCPPFFASALVLALVLAVGAVQAGNWERFRGPNGTGTVADRDVPVEFSATKNLRWKTPIPGLGNSSPIIWGKKLFLQSSTTDGKERMLLCLNADDGKILWSRLVPGHKAKIHQKNSLASSTPACDGERVYGLFWDGGDVALHAFDMDGNPLWNHSFGTFTSQHGPGASPVVFQNRVFLANDQDGAATFYAFDTKTGKIAWQAPRTPFRACYSSPFLLDKGGKLPELIVASTAGITSYDPIDGKVHWNWTWSFDNMALRTVGSPIASNGLILATSGDGGGARNMVAIKDSGVGDVTSSNLVWQHKKARPYPYVPTILAHGDYIYFVNDRGDAGCTKAKTGEQVWVEHLGANISSSPILVDGKVYAPAEDGVVYVFEASPTFKLLARNSLGQDVLASPAVANSRLYIRGKEHLFCVGKADAAK